MKKIEKKILYLHQQLFKIYTKVTENMKKTCYSVMSKIKRQF